MPRFAARDANRRGSSRVVDLRGLAGVALVSAFLPGCPLSDSYYVDANGTGGHTAANGGETTVGGAAGGGSAASAGTGGSNGGGGSGGTSGTGAQAGTEAKGGTGGGAGSTDCSDEPERCDGIDNNCNDESDEDGVCPQGCSVEINDSHRYLICVAATKAEGLDTDGAAARCSELAQELELDASFGLAWIESEEENDFLRTWLGDNLSGSAVVWIGASDRDEENLWVWGTGSDAVQFFVGDSGGGGTPYQNRFNDWASGSPRALNGEDQDCGAFDTGLSLHWDDRACDSVERGFICEEDPPTASR